MQMEDGSESTDGNINTLHKTVKNKKMRYTFLKHLSQTTSIL